MKNFVSANQTALCPSGVPTTFIIVLSMVSFLAFTGNLLVIITFINTVNLKTSSNYFIVNMAVSDLVSVIFTWPLYATEGMLKAGGSLITDPTLTAIFCKLGIYSKAVSYAVSILSLVLIAVDRFIATAFPLKASKVTRRIRTTFLTLCWCVPAVILVPYFVYSKTLEIEKHTFCRNMMGHLELKIYNFLGFTLFYCAPLVLIVVLYSLIMKNLRRRLEPESGERSGVMAKRLKQNQNVMKIFASIVLGFFICWTPLYVYMFLKSLYPSIFVKCLLLKLVGSLYYIFPQLSTAINPFILITLSSNYRAAIKSMCASLLQKNCSRQDRQFVPRAIAPQRQTVELLEFNILSTKITQN